jgi:hypothetical protein
VIRYSLVCHGNHAFEGWFASSSAFDDQKARGLLSCPACGSPAVEKALMAPSIGGTRQNLTEDGAPAVTPQAPVADLPVALLGEREVALRAAVKALRQEIAKHSEDVGDRFAEEARKIHYGERDGASIHGRATLDEAVELAEEGVAFLPLPGLADDTN